MILSVIIPVYKVEKFIADCLQSVMHQTYDRFECILIDDHTPDRSMAIVEQLLDAYQGNIRFKLLRHQENQAFPLRATPVCRLLMETTSPLLIPTTSFCPTS